MILATALLGALADEHEEARSVLTHTTETFVLDGLGYVRAVNELWRLGSVRGNYVLLSDCSARVPNDWRSKTIMAMHKASRHVFAATFQGGIEGELNPGGIVLHRTVLERLSGLPDELVTFGWHIVLGKEMERAGMPWVVADAKLKHIHNKARLNALGELYYTQIKDDNTIERLYG